jgi:sugar O-acyltransferase (sialic acid O-acetyltransferase NeuD family)
VTALSFVLFGVDSSFSAEVIETLRRLGHSVAAGIVTGAPEWPLEGIDVLREESEVEPALRGLPAVVPWVTPKLRMERTERAKRAGFTRFDAVIDPTAIIARNANIGEGVFINAGAIVGADVAIAEHAVMNRAASVGHHSTIEPFAAIGPRAVVASKCTIGRGVLIGAGAVVGPGVTLGAACMVALGGVVARDVAPGATVAGNPARLARPGS